MAFTAQEKERIRYHLGYLEVGAAASISFGIPRPIQTIFLVESAMDLVLDVAEDRVRRIVATLDNIECRLEQSIDVLEASQLGDLQTRENAPELIEREYVRWASRLADVLGVPLYPYSARFRKYVGGAQAGSIPVRRP